MARTGPEKEKRARDNVCSVHVGLLLLHVDIKPTLVRASAHRPLARRDGARVVFRELACVHLDLINNWRHFFSFPPAGPAMSRPICVLGALLSRLRRKQQWLQCRDTATDHAHVSLHSGPHPELEALPSYVIRLEEHIMNPVRAEAARDDDDAAEAEEEDESNALTGRKR